MKTPIAESQRGPLADAEAPGGSATSGQLSGQCTLGCGASRGLGLLIARELVDRGFFVALAARDADELREAAAEFGDRVSTHVLDVADRDAVATTVQEVQTARGGIEVAISIAGVIQVGPAADMTLDHFDQAIDIMARGPINVSWSVLPGMKAQGHGRIGVVSSVGGVIAPPHLLPYATAKFAALGFAEGLAAELSGTPVTATAIVPGLMRTGSQDRATFTGNSDAEHAWFSVAASLPGLSMSGERAAKQIVSGVLRGRPLVTLTPLSWAAYRVRGLAPATTARLMGFASQLLPAPTGNTDSVEGRLTHTPRIVAKLSVLGRRAAARHNER